VRDSAKEIEPPEFAGGMVLAYSDPVDANPASQQWPQGQTDEAGVSSKPPEGVTQIAANLISPTFGLGTQKITTGGDEYGTGNAGAAAGAGDERAGTASQPDRANITSDSFYSIGGGQVKFSAGADRQEREQKKS